MTRMQSTKRQSVGVTLIEMMVAMTIFSVLGVFLFTLTRGSMEIYRSVQSSGSYRSSFDQTLVTMEEDLLCLWSGDGQEGGAPAWLYLTHDRTYPEPQETEGGGAPMAAPSYASGDARSFLLCFTRTFPGGELNNTASRFAGTYTDGQGYLNGFDDVAESRARKLRKVTLQRENVPDWEQTQLPGLLPPGGLQEVAYFLQDEAGEIPGLLTLFRAVRSPVGGAGSFGRANASAGFTPEWIQANASPVVSGVIWFGLLCWSQHTREWEAERVLDGQGLSSGDGPSEWSEFWWDSTRARHEKFGLHRGASSAGNAEDDVFPSRVRLVVTFAKDGGRADARLAGRIDGKTRFVRVTNVDALDPDNPQARYLRVDDEWMEVVSISGNELTVARGVRSTSAVRHENSAPVLVGRSFVHDIEIPAARSFFQGPGEAR